MEIILRILQFAAPVGYAALGESVNQRAGTLNIGLEGTMLTAAFTSVAVAGATHSWLLGLLAGIVSAVLICLILAFFVLKLAADQVVVGTAINLFAMGVTSTLYEAVYGRSGKLISVPKLPTFGWFDPWILLLAILTILIAWMLTKTKFGLALRAAGEYPKAVEASGFNALQLRFAALMISAVLAGLAGTYLSLGIAGSFAANMTAGRGFMAIAMVTFGRWKPWGVIGASILIGTAEQAQFMLQSQGWGIPYQVFAMLPYALALIVLMIAGKGTSVPMDLGRPFRRVR